MRPNDPQRQGILDALAALIPGGVPDHMSATLTETTPHGARHTWTGSLAGLADRIATAAPVDLPMGVRCGASILGGGNQPLGPCVLRATHVGPVHQDASGVIWWPTDAELARLFELLDWGDQHADTNMRVAAYEARGAIDTLAKALLQERRPPAPVDDNAAGGAPCGS